MNEAFSKRAQVQIFDDRPASAQPVVAFEWATNDGRVCVISIAHDDPDTLRAVTERFAQIAGEGDPVMLPSASLLISWSDDYGINAAIEAILMLPEVSQ